MFPDWLASHLVAEGAFAEAYDAQSPQHRAWIKKTMAQLAASVPAVPGVRRVDRDFGAWARRDRSVSCAWAVLAVGDGAVSPVKTVAALMPMLLAGVPEILLLRVGATSFPAPVLAAVELAGVDRAAVLAPDAAHRLMEHLDAASQPGVTAVLDAHVLDHLHPGPPSAAVRTWHPACGVSVGVWAEEGGWDLAAALWAHPDAVFTVWGAGEGLPEGVEARNGDAAAFFAQGYDTLLVPPRMAARAMEHADVVLCPGQEGCWAWPNLTTHTFTFKRVALLG